MVGKLPLKRLVGKSLKEHYIKCPGEALIPLGYSTDIDLKDSGKYPIWIQDEVIYHLIKCPSLFHGILAAELLFTIKTSLDRSTGQKLFLPAGKTDWLLTNELGRHITFQTTRLEPHAKVAIQPKPEIPGIHH